MAKFRNILVHMYEDVEAKRLHIILEKDLEDIREFIKHVLMSAEKS